MELMQPQCSGTFTLIANPSVVWEPKVHSTKEFWIQKTMQHTCSPCRAKYKVDVNYTLGLPQYNVNTEPVDCLTDFWHSVDLNADDKAFSFSNSAQAVDNLRATNLWLLVDSLVNSLAGEIICSPIDNATNVTIENFKSPDNQTIATAPASAYFCGYPGEWEGAMRVEVTTTDGLPEPSNGTIMLDTMFNSRRFASKAELVELSVSEALLNSALVNITLSIMNRLNIWPTEAQVAYLQWADAYQFKEPSRLIVPYFAALALALPFLLIGFVAFLKNGVAAPTDRFVDVLILGATSEEIRDAAKDISFEKSHGYAHGVERLGKLKVRYGEIGRSTGVRERRAERLRTENEEERGKV